jgi:hypothetical protein
MYFPNGNLLIPNIKKVDNKRIINALSNIVRKTTGVLNKRLNLDKKIITATWLRYVP